MDAFGGLLDGPRARGVFALRTIMSPPWSVRIEDGAPLSLIAIVRGDAWFVPVHGDAIPLGEQDRSLWDRGLIARGTDLLDAAVAMGRIGEYQLQAAIAAIHDRAPSAAETDWPQIVALYGLLERMTGNPVVTLNRAVAAALAEGPSAGLAILDAMNGDLAGNHRSAAVRAFLLEMAGDTDAAVEHYRRAARLTSNLPEQRHLAAKAARLAARDG
jgi:predicted RNA polymerase sigma factor